MREFSRPMISGANSPGQPSRNDVEPANRLLARASAIFGAWSFAL